MRTEEQCYIQVLELDVRKLSLARKVLKVVVLIQFLAILTFMIWG